MKYLLAYSWIIWWFLILRMLDNLCFARWLPSCNADWVMHCDFNYFYPFFPPLRWWLLWVSLESSSLESFSVSFESFERLLRSICCYIQSTLSSDNFAIIFYYLITLGYMSVSYNLHYIYNIINYLLLKTKPFVILWAEILIIFLHLYRYFKRHQCWCSDQPSMWVCVFRGQTGPAPHKLNNSSLHSLQSIIH